MAKRKKKKATKPTAAAVPAAPVAEPETVSGRNVGDNLSGHRIYIQCRKPAKKWVLFQMTNQHKGSRTTAHMGAYAEIEQAYKK